MGNLNTKQFFAAVGLIGIFLVGLTVESIHSENVNNDQMKACVAAGKQWVRSGHSSYYECK